MELRCLLMRQWPMPWVSIQLACLCIRECDCRMRKILHINTGNTSQFDSFISKSERWNILARMHHPGSSLHTRTQSQMGSTPGYLCTHGHEPSRPVNVRVADTITVQNNIEWTPSHVDAPWLKAACKWVYINEHTHIRKHVLKKCMSIWRTVASTGSPFRRHGRLVILCVKIVSRFRKELANFYAC